MTPLERREAGLPYVYNDKAILDEQYQYQDELAKYNRTMPSEHEKRAEMLSNLMAEVGENCTIDTPVHPQLRELRYVYTLPIHVGRNVWIGSGVQIMPGVTIGDNSVIGAGSVVTKDIPANVVAVGSPCRVLREIGEHDRKYYYKDHQLDFDPDSDELP